MKSSFKLGSGLIAIAAIATVAFVACSDSTPPPDAGANQDGGLTCVAQPGVFPDPGCNPGETTTLCKAQATTCAIDKAACGDPKTCMPMGADNTGKSVVDLRFRRLTLVAPPSLATIFVQDNVVTKGIDLKKAECAEQGDGAFNWLARIDKTKNTLTTGGAPPSTDAYGKGYCFYQKVVGALTIIPETIPVTFAGSVMNAQPIQQLNVPIFVDGDINNIVILPIRGATLKSATISADGNCVGSFNQGALLGDCKEYDVATCPKWITGGSIGGHMTLEDADKVHVSLLNVSLCKILTKSTNPGETCPRDGSNNIIPKGDYCSKTNKPGDCQDSYWLAATFAASAVKIYDGASEPNCMPLPAGDAGTDSGATDATAD